MWRGRGTSPITAAKLLPPGFVGDLGGRHFETKSDWEKYKADVTKMARWHGKILREIRAGKRKSTVIWKAVIKEEKKG